MGGEAGGEVRVCNEGDAEYGRVGLAGGEQGGGGFFGEPGADEIGAGEEGPEDGVEVRRQGSLGDVQVGDSEAANGVCERRIRFCGVLRRSGR